MIAGQLEIQLLANLARLQKDMDDAKRSVGGAMDSIEKSVNLAKTALGALGVGLSVGAFTGWINGAIDAADHLNDLSKSTNIAVEDLAGLKLAAQQSGTDLDGVAKAVNKLSVEMGKDAEKFARVGITAKDPIEALKQLSDVFVSIQDPQARAAFGAAALGKQWESVAPLLSEGGQKIGEMVEKGKRLSGVTQEMADEADRFNDQMAEMKAAADGFATKLASDMLPGMNNAVIAIKQAYEESGKLSALWTSMGALGAFLFTDEFSSAAVKIKNFEKEIQDLDAMKKKYSGPSVLQQILIGSDEEIAAKIASAKSQIEALKKSTEKPGAKPKGWTSGGDLPAGVQDFINGEDAAKKRDALIKKSEEFIFQIKKEAATLGATAEEKKQYDSDEMARQMRLAGVRDDVLAKFLDNSRKELEAFQVRQDKFNADKATLAAAEAHTKFLESLEDGLKKLKEDADAQQDYNDRIGLTKEAIAALDAAKLEEQATTLEGIAIKRLDKDLDEGVYNLYKAQAEELRKLAELKKRGATKEVISDQLKKDAEEAQKILDNLRENIQRNLGDELFNMLDGNFENIGDSFKRMLMRMVADATAADIMSAIGLGKGGGGLGSLIGGFFGGGGYTGAAGADGAGSVAEFMAMDAMASFDGGGFTGDGSRSGGLDGKGGFLAMMHPRETVVDHTRGQSAGKQVTVHYAPTFNVDSRTDRAELMRDLQRMQKATIAEMEDRIERAS